jgi:hypothetical protein
VLGEPVCDEIIDLHVRRQIRQNPAEDWAQISATGHDLVPVLLEKVRLQLPWFETEVSLDVSIPAASIRGMHDHTIHIDHEYLDRHRHS